MKEPKRPFRFANNLPDFSHSIINNRKLTHSFSANSFITHLVLDFRLKEIQIIIIIHLGNRKAVRLPPDMNRLWWLEKCFAVIIKPAKSDKKQTKNQVREPF
jgi:hypothetical protein